MYLFTISNYVLILTACFNCNSICNYYCLCKGIMNLDMEKQAKGHVRHAKSKILGRGYKTFSMLTSAQHDVLNAINPKKNI